MLGEIIQYVPNGRIVRLKHVRLRSHDVPSKNGGLSDAGYRHEPPTALFLTCTAETKQSTESQGQRRADGHGLATSRLTSTGDDGSRSVDCVNAAPSVPVGLTSIA